MRTQTTIILIIGALLRLGILFTHPYAIMSDDGYYYLSIAANVHAGNGFSLDGVEQTNGFQPLWMAVSLLVTWMTNNPHTTIILIGLISTILWFASGIILQRLLKYYHLTNWTLVAISLFAVAPMALLQTLNGLETPLTVLLLLSTLFWYQTKISTNATTKDHIIFGALSGLLLLSRLDTIFFLACIGIDYLARHRPNALRITAVACTALLIITPYLIFNATIGKTSIDSSEPNRTLSLAVAHKLTGGYIKTPLEHQTPLYTLLIIRSGLYSLLQQPLFNPLFIITLLHLPQLIAQLTVLIATSAIIYWHRKNIATTITWIRKQKLTFVMISITLTILYYTIYQFTPWFFERYFFPLGILLLIPAGKLLEKHLNDGGYKTLAIYLIILIIIAGNTTLNTHYRTAQYAQKHLPEGSIIGAPQSGALSFLTDFTVVNLDGKVNSEAHKAFKEKTLDTYICERHIQYIIDWEGGIEDFVIARMKNPEILQRIDEHNGIATYETRCPQD